jgi:hypothetical protein
MEAPKIEKEAKVWTSFLAKCDPIPKPQNCVVRGNARFTSISNFFFIWETFFFGLPNASPLNFRLLSVLSDGCVRLEFDPTKMFCDQPTQIVIRRNCELQGKFEVTSAEDKVEVRTDLLHLVYISKNVR